VPRMGRRVESNFWIVTLNSELTLGSKLAGYTSGPGISLASARDCVPSCLREGSTAPQTGNERANGEKLHDTKKVIKAAVDLSPCFPPWKLNGEDCFRSNLNITSLLLSPTTTKMRYQSSQVILLFTSHYGCSKSQMLVADM
jgi:hypothetical protein